jgi:uncharacterized membrane protein (DUF2068 family)
MQSVARHRHHDVGLALIASLKLVYGVLLLALGIGAIWLINKDLTAFVSYWADVLEISSENHHLQRLLENAGLIRTNHLAWVSAITLFYSALSFAMGFGLWLEKRWAEYLTAFVAASFIPFELYELLRHFRVMTDLILTINIVTVIYLIGKLREGRGTSRQTT